MSAALFTLNLKVITLSSWHHLSHAELLEPFLRTFAICPFLTMCLSFLFVSSQRTYQEWVCSMVLPYVGMEESEVLEQESVQEEEDTSGVVRTRGRRRRVKRRMEVIRKPCREMCERVEQRCPYFHPSHKEQYAGEPAFLCIGTHTALFLDTSVLELFYPFLPILLFFRVLNSRRERERWRGRKGKMKPISSVSLIPRDPNLPSSPFGSRTEQYSVSLPLLFNSGTNSLSNFVLFSFLSSKGASERCSRLTDQKLIPYSSLSLSLLSFAFNFISSPSGVFLESIPCNILYVFMCARERVSISNIWK